MTGPMTRFRGEGASRGIAIGPAHVVAAKITVAERRILRRDRAAEVAHLEEGISAADEQLDHLQRQLADRKGAGADLVQAHRMMLRSPEVAGEARRLILEECFAAEWAVTRALDEIRATFLRIQDPYFRERGGDFEAVGERLIRTLLGLPELRAGAETPAGSIAVGTDLAPLDPFHLQAAGVIGIVTEHGGKTSHAAIVARALELPYVVGVKQIAGRVVPGAVVIVDGARGDVVIDPTAEALQTYRARATAERLRDTQLLAEKDLPALTTDGVGIHLRANVESLLGVASVTASGAEGIGLFRTEFLYLERPDLPTEDEQYRDALSVLNAVGGLPVTFRTLDLGGDKLPSAFRMPEGPNPALGVRSIRFSLERPDIFRTQLRALYRASASGPVRLMLPLVTGPDELRRALAICASVRGGPGGGGRRARSGRAPRDHARNAERGGDRRSARARRRLLQHRHERSHPVRLRRRSRERSRRAPAASVATRRASPPQADDRRSGACRHPDLDLRRHGERSLADVAAPRPRVARPVDGPPFDPDGQGDHSSLVARGRAGARDRGIEVGSEQDTARLIQDAMGPQFAADLEAFLPAQDA